MAARAACGRRPRRPRRPASRGRAGWHRPAARKPGRAARGARTTPPERCRRPPEERGATATRSDLDALAGQLRGEIRDLARALKDVQSPLPRILAMTRDVREAVTGIQASQGQTGQALQRLEQASASLAITTDYLVALAEEDEGEDEDFGEDEELQAADAGDEATEPTANTEDSAAPGDGDEQPTTP